MEVGNGGGGNHKVMHEQSLPIHNLLSVISKNDFDDGGDQVSNSDM